MGTFKGKRIIPKHDGVWDQKKEYEELTIVLDAESGDGYISRKPVPAGTVLSDTDYWSLCSHFNAQMHRLETDVAEDVEGIRRERTGCICCKTAAVQCKKAESDYGFTKRILE